MRVKNRVLLIFTIAGICLLMTAGSVFAAEKTAIPDELNYLGKLVDLPGSSITSNKKDAAVINYLFIRNYGSDLYFDEVTNGFFVVGWTYKGKGQCYGYAEQCRKMFGTGGKKTGIHKRMTKKNLYKYLLGCRPGTHLRISATKNGNGYHSLCVLGVSKKYLWFTETSDSKNPMFFYKVRVADLAKDFGSEYMAWKIEPTGRKYARKAAPKAASYVANGTVELAWVPVKGAKSYTVYRSTSKKSGYKKVKTVKKPFYTDRNAPIGKCWYKVKAAGGKKSKAVKAVRKLVSPVVKYIVQEDGTAALTWKAVKGADKYLIYKKNEDQTKWAKVDSTKGTEYTWSGSRKKDIYLLIRSARSGKPDATSYGTVVRIDRAGN